MKSIARSSSIRNAVLRHVVGALLVAVPLLLANPAELRGADEGRTKAVAVYVYPHEITKNDQLLVDGKNGKAIPIETNSTLVWVDLHPEARFAHATEFILISAKGAEVVKGTWWPILNGEDLFRGEPAFWIKSPLDLSSE